MVQSLDTQRLRPSKRDLERAFRGARFGAATSAMAWRYTPAPGILLPTEPVRATANLFIHYGYDMANAGENHIVDAAVAWYEPA